MTQEDKELLLKDLCARLPYGVKMNHIADDEHSPKTLIGVAKNMITLEGLGGYECVDIEDYKPYLFPLSSMTEEQKYTCPIGVANLEAFIKNESWTYLELSPDSILSFIDWLNTNPFDYRGLIPKGLAIDATELNIY